VDLESYLRVFSGLAESRSRIYGLLSQLYVRPPDGEFLRELFSPEFSEILSNLLAQPTISGELEEGLKLLKKFIEDWRGCGGGLLKLVSADRNRLLKPEGRRGAYESSHLGSAEEVVRFYREAGAQLPADGREPPDFIGFELDFMRLLCAEEAEAWKAGKVEEALRLLEREEAFLSRHVAAWVPSFCEAMFEQAELDLYRGLAKLTKGFVEQDHLLLKELLRGAGEG